MFIQKIESKFRLFQGLHLGNSMSKVQEKRSMSKTNFFMMKYERTKGYEMVFTVFKPNFGFWANLGQQLK